MATPPQQDELTLTAREHLLELRSRLAAIGRIAAIGLAICFWQSAWVVSVGRFVGMAIERPTTISDRLLWSAFLFVPLGSCQLIGHVYGFVRPGLYQSERRLVLFPMIWAVASPFLALLALKAYITLSAGVPLPQLSSPAEFRVWSIRAYCLLLVGAAGFALPRTARRVTSLGLIASVAVVCLTPNHAFDTALLTGQMLLVAIPLLGALAVRLVAERWLP